MKKKKETISTNAIILIVIGITALVVLIIGFTFGWEKIAPWLQDEFTITKEECWNETIKTYDGDVNAGDIFPFEEYDYKLYNLDVSVVSFEIFDFIRDFCKKRLEEQGISVLNVGIGGENWAFEYIYSFEREALYGWDLSLEGMYCPYERIIESNDEFSYIESGNLDLDGYTLQIPPYNESLVRIEELKGYLGKVLINGNKYWRVNIVSTKEKEICETVEVEEIKVIHGNLGDKIILDIEGNEVYRLISKKDFTTEWLDENCECFEVYDKDKKEKISCGKYEDYLCPAFTNRPEYFQCSKYKYGDYKVIVE